MTSLKDRKIVIAGAAGGFGQAIVSKLAAQGATLILAGTKADEVKKVAEAAKSQGAKAATAHQFNATDEASVKKLFEDIQSQHGNVDTLVYLPGMSIASPVTDMAEEAYDKIIDVNFKGLFLTTKYFIPLTRPEDNPLIGLVTSQAATRPNPNAPVYCAAKAAVSMFGQGLAMQVMSKNIRVTNIKPGPVDTQGFWGDRPVPREKFMKAEDVASVVEFVLSMPTHVVMHEVNFESFEFLKK